MANGSRDGTRTRASASAKGSRRLERRENVESIERARVACDSGLWGWKTPKSLYYLPVLDDIFAARAAADAAARSARMLLVDAARESAAAALVFAGAHAHHYVGMRARGASTSRAFRACRAQMTFTAVFGAMACRVFSRTESLAAATACHSACNLIGAPSAASFRDARGVAAHVLGVVCAMAALTFF